MAALKGAELDRFLARPDPTRPIVLLFGPDAGLVRERAETMIRACVDDPRDPFALARIDGDSLADQPARLIEEAHTLPLFGGRRAVWVKAGGRNFAAALEALIASPPGADCRVVIEAGDLKRGAPLRALCERARNVAALACYADGERELSRLIDEELGGAGLAIASEARALLMALLGADRTASRSELRKLALYGHKQQRIEIDDVLAVVADASALAFDGVIDAAFAGRPQEVEAQYAKARGAGTPPGVMAAAALRQAAQLHRARLDIEAGADVAEALAGFAPPVHFRREKLVADALSSWTSARLERAMRGLAETLAETRRRPALADALARGALLSIAVAGRRK
jgi:DNA polymerase-3 subunit delta